MEIQNEEYVQSENRRKIDVLFGFIIGFVFGLVGVLFICLFNFRRKFKDGALYGLIFRIFY